MKTTEFEARRAPIEGSKGGIERLGAGDNGVPASTPCFGSRRDSKRPNTELIWFREENATGFRWPSSWIRAYEKYPPELGEPAHHAERVLRRYRDIFGDSAGLA